MLQFESEQGDFTEDRFLLKGQRISELEPAADIDQSDQFVFSKHIVASKRRYAVTDHIVRETVYPTELSVDPFDDPVKGIDTQNVSCNVKLNTPALIPLTDKAINNIYIKTTYDSDDTKLSGMLAKGLDSNIRELSVVLPKEPVDKNEPFDFYWHFCWINQIVYPMNSYDQWMRDIYTKLKHTIKAKIYDTDGNYLDSYEFRNIEHEDCFSLIRDEDGVNHLTKYKGVADLVQYQDDHLALVGSSPIADLRSSSLNSDRHISRKMSYSSFVDSIVRDISANIDFGGMAWKDQYEYALVKHLHDYSYTEVYPYYTATDANNNMYNLVGIVDLSNSAENSQVSIWLPEIEEPLFFKEDCLIGELKGIALGKYSLPAVDVDSPYFDGWVYCDGTSYPKVDFPDAYEVFKYAEGSTDKSFVVPYYNTDFIKSNPNLPELRDDPLKKVPYHNYLPDDNGGPHTHGSVDGSRPILAFNKKEIKWKFPATGPDKKKIKKEIAKRDAGKDYDSDIANSEHLLDERVNKATKSVKKFTPENLSTLIIHGGESVKKSFTKKELDTEISELADWNDVDLLSTSMTILENSSKANFRIRYATQPILDDKKFDVNSSYQYDVESHPSYQKLVMMVYIGRKAEV